jgi:hypothetical protein
MIHQFKDHVLFILTPKSPPKFAEEAIFSFMVARAVLTEMTATHQLQGVQPDAWF